MGKRDYRWREPKKSKKGERKTKSLSEIPPQVEVVGKRKKKPSAEE